MLVAASVVLALTLLYTVFGVHLPARRHIAALEAELKTVYAREAELQTRVAQLEQRQTPRERQLATLSAERDALARQVDELERQLVAARRRK
jgi:septal ring factor EnvC (AmiA/AmiB activator)